MRLATANIWGLPAPLSWPPRHWRFPRVRRFLEEAHDVVLLQEHWRLPGRPQALDDLDLLTPTGHRGDAGLALKTRLRVVEHAGRSFTNGAVFALERLFCRKGWQRVTLEVDGVQIDVVNTHLEAHPSERHARVRALQVEELLAEAARAGGPAVLAGDFNLHEHVARDRECLARIEAAGFVDVVAAHDPTPTYHRLGVRERFDRVFVRGLACVSARVDVAARLADHRPVMVELRPQTPARPIGRR